VYVRGSAGGTGAGGAGEEGGALVPGALSRKVLSRPWALFALVFSCSPFLQWYGNEARMYSMLVLVTLVSQYFFLTLVADDRRSAWIGYAVTAGVGVYVHYFSSSSWSPRASSSC
jgi:hypothetical protein